MSMNIYLEGYKPVDDKWTAMKKAYDACRSAGVSIPKEILAFFNHEPPQEEGVTVNLARYGCESDYKKGVTPLKQEYRDGFIVNLNELDPEIRTLKFIVSY